MRVGQTSIIVFLSKIVASAIGFVATLYFARVLGAEVIGLYALLLTVVAWLILLSDLGIGEALIKRISEGHEQGAYLSAAIVLILSLVALTIIFVGVFRSLIEVYLSGFDQHVAISVVWFVVMLIFVRLFFNLVIYILKGERKVHIGSGILNSLQIGAQSVIQVGLVVLGYGLFGMLVGYIIGTVLVGTLGIYWVATRPMRPVKRHFQKLIEYAKFSWLGGLKSRTFNEIDILILGVFVQTSLVGVYAVAWSIARFINLFGDAISGTLFPEISRISAQESNQATAGLVEDSLKFTGLIAMPGLIGGLVLRIRLLRLYGDEFTRGATVLVLLILAVLIYSYQQQLLNALNGLDRPDLAFRINLLFILLNIILNVLFIWQYGILGAAIATILATTIALLLAFLVVSQLITLQVPFGELLRQGISAMTMGGVIWGILQTVTEFALIEHNASLVVILVGLGAILYFGTLFTISPTFRATVARNLPIKLPRVQ